MTQKTQGKKEYTVGLDIGSTAIRMAVGHMMQQGEKEVLHIVGATEAPAEGVQRGVVTSIEDTVSSISSCLERLERMIGVPIENAWVGVSGTHILTQSSHGVVAVAKSDGEITEEDVERVIEASRAIATPLNYEILHVIPRGFTVDGQEGVRDPIGMTGVRLEVDTQIILGLSSQIKNLTKAIYRTGLDINDMVLGILATSEVVTTHRQKELGVGVVNIGGATTSIAVFENGDFLHSAVLPIGSEHITSDIAIGLRTSIDIAERVKIEYGTIGAKEITKKEEINLQDVGAPEEEWVSRKYVAEIIDARVEEIFEKIDKELAKIRRAGLLPAGVICTGGGAKLAGLIPAAKKYLRLPVDIGYPMQVTSVTDKVHDIRFSTAIGLVGWGTLVGMHTAGIGNMIERFRTVDKVSEQVKKWFKSFLP